MAAPVTHETESCSSPATAGVQPFNGGSDPTWGSRVSGRIYKQRAHSTHLRLSFEDCHQFPHRARRHLGVFMEKQDKLAFGCAQSDVQRFGQTEIAGKQDEPYIGEFAFELGAAVGRTAVNYQKLDGCTVFGTEQALQAAPEERCPVVRNDDY